MYFQVKREKITTFFFTLFLIRDNFYNNFSNDLPAKALLYYAWNTNRYLLFYHTFSTSYLVLKATYVVNAILLLKCQAANANLMANIC